LRATPQTHVSSAGWTLGISPGETRGWVMKALLGQEYIAIRVKRMVPEHGAGK
jgi:hypothetical protein